MGLQHLTVAGLLASVAAAATNGTCTKKLTWTEGALRMNHVQVVGTHNSYHLESPLSDRPTQQILLPGSTINYWYAHPQLDIQLADQQVRNLEIDVLADPEGGNYARPLIRTIAGTPHDEDPIWQEPGTKVLHVPDSDIETLCKSLVSCLQIIKGWMDANPQAVPLPIMMEFKTADRATAILGGAKVIAWDNAELLDGLDAEIRSVFGPDQLLTPDDIRQGDLTLEDSVLEYGWPDLDSARGRVFFLMDNGPDHPVRFKYNEDRPSLEGRVLFTNSAPGDADCAFQKLNEPDTEENIANIQEQVRANYWVRTRADVPMNTILDNCSTVMRDNAFRSGAQIVSTDFQAYGMSARWGCDYVAKLPQRKAAICNPINGPDDCDDSDGLEPAEYRLKPWP